ncbi:MAG: hypothetical protein ABH821_00755, partial [archaeon]
MVLVSFTDNLKDVYYSLEEKNPMLPKLLILVVIILIGLVVYFLFAAPITPVVSIGQEVEVTVKIVDVKGLPVNEASVEVYFADSTSDIKTTNSEGITKIRFNDSESVNLTISKKDYLSISQLIDASQLEYILTLPVSSGSFSKTLRFADPNSLLLSKDRITVDLTCVNPAISPVPDKAIVTNGELKVEIPEGCNGLIVNANADNFKDLISFRLDDSETIVTLTPEEIGNEIGGTIKVKVLDNANNKLLDNMQVLLFNENDPVNYVSVKYSVGGEAKFSSVLPGNYYVTVSDVVNDAYYSNKSETITLKPDDLIELELKLDKPEDLGEDENYFVIVKVLDKTTLQWLDNTTVKLLNDLNETISQKGSNGLTEVKFRIDKDLNYYLVATNPEYYGEKVSADYENNEINFYLEKIDFATSGNLKVHVIDDEDNNVSNARLVIYNAKTGFIDERLIPQTTDVYGNTEFKGVKEGTYFVKAEKYPAEAVSEEFEITIGTVTEIEVMVEIGYGKINLTVENEFGEKVISDTEFYDNSGTKIGSDTTDAEGFLEKTFRADQKVFVKIIPRNTNYANYFTQPIQVIKDQDYGLTIKLKNKLETIEPGMEFIGLYSDREKRNETTNPLPGQKYYAFYRIESSSQSLSETALQTRFGVQATAEQDIMLIEGINAPLNPDTRMYSKFTGNYNDDKASITSSNGKWANIKFDGTPGSKIVMVTVRVKNTASPDEPYYFYFHSWSKKASNYYVTPADNSLPVNAVEQDVWYALAEFKVFHAPSDLQEMISSPAIYDSEDIQLTNPDDIIPGQTYKVKWNLSVGSPLVMDKYQVYLRAGEEVNVIDDVLSLNNVTVEGITPTANYKYAKFSDNYNDTLNSVTSGEAKLVVLEFDYPEQGEYTITADLKIESTAEKEELILYFKANGKKGPAYYSDPKDTELSQTPSDEELMYAEDDYYNFGTGEIPKKCYQEDYCI